jgi:hypothetical protein
VTARVNIPGNFFFFYRFFFDKLKYTREIVVSTHSGKSGESVVFFFSSIDFF